MGYWSFKKLDARCRCETGHRKSLWKFEIVAAAISTIPIIHCYTPSHHLNLSSLSVKRSNESLTTIKWGRELRFSIQSLGDWPKSFRKLLSLGDPKRSSWDIYTQAGSSRQWGIVPLSRRVTAECWTIILFSRRCESEEPIDGHMLLCTGCESRELCERTGVIRYWLLPSAVAV